MTLGCLRVLTGFAMLAALPPGEAEAVLEANREVLARDYPALPPERLRELAARAREAGYALNPGLVFPDSWGIGVALRRPDGGVAGAILFGLAGKFVDGHHDIDHGDPDGQDSGHGRRTGGCSRRNGCGPSRQDSESSISYKTRAASDFRWKTVRPV